MKGDKEILDLFGRNLAYLVVIQLNLFYTIKVPRVGTLVPGWGCLRYETMKGRSLVEVA